MAFLAYKEGVFRKIKGKIRQAALGIAKDTVHRWIESQSYPRIESDEAVL